MHIKSFITSLQINNDLIVITLSTNIYILYISCVHIIWCCMFKRCRFGYSWSVIDVSRGPFILIIWWDVTPCTLESLKNRRVTENVKLDWEYEPVYGSWFIPRIVDMPCGMGWALMRYWKFGIWTTEEVHEPSLILRLMCGIVNGALEVGKFSYVQIRTTKGFYESWSVLWTVKRVMNGVSKE